MIELGSRAVRLYPIFHPAAALYTPRMLETLREDFSRLPELLALGPRSSPSRSSRCPSRCRPTGPAASPRRRTTSSGCSESPSRASASRRVQKCPAAPNAQNACKEGLFRPLSKKSARS